MKPKIAIAWNSSCGGCDEAIVDIEEKILILAEKVEFVLWPCAMDFKYDSIRAMEDNSIDLALINGGIQNSEQEHIVKMLRQKSKHVVSFGSCATFGGVPGLINLKSKSGMFAASYQSNPTVVNPEGTVPQVKTDVNGCILHLPEIFETLHKLDDIIAVDFYLPGCPPTAKLIVETVMAFLENRLPAKGSFLIPNKSLCSSCARNATKPEVFTIDQVKRIHEIQADPEICFLAQGVICMGPATRDGCEAACIEGNMPCTGCFGPIGELDQGAQMISALAGIMSGETEQSADKTINSIIDPAGTFYRYTAAASLLGRRR